MQKGVTQMNGIVKAPFRIMGSVFISLVSFLVMLTLAGIFIAAIGFGLGSVLGKSDFGGGTESSYAFVSGTPESSNLLLTIPVQGIILGSASLNLDTPLGIMGATYGYEVRKTLENAAEDERIKGVMLHMQTPGGTIFGSQAIFNGVKAYQEATGRPVLAFVEGLSASGGVMAMVGADAIYADYGSMVGSIGVIGAQLTFYDKPVATQGGIFGGGIVTEEGIEQTIISAGKYKDLGNPFRRPSTEEIARLNRNIANEYDDFVRHVAENREIKPEMIRDEMGAMIFDNLSAQSYGLIDGTLDKNGAVEKLAEMANVADEYKLVTPKQHRRQFWKEILLSSEARASRRGSPQALNGAAFHEALRLDLCESVRHMPLAYHGDVSALRAACAEGGGLR